MRAYYGYLPGMLAVEVFASKERPTVRTHPQYVSVVGPFSNVSAAARYLERANARRNVRVVLTKEKRGGEETVGRG